MLSIKLACMLLTQRLLLHEINENLFYLFGSINNNDRWLEIGLKRLVLSPIPLQKVTEKDTG